MKLTAKQRKTILDSFRKNNDIGFGRAFAHAGLALVDAQIKAQFAEDPTLLEEINEARGRNIEAVEGSVWKVAVDTDHAAWDRANARVLKAYHPAFRDRTEVEHTGQLEVTNPDVAAAIERFTSQVVRLATRGRAELTAGEPGS